MTTPLAGQVGPTAPIASPVVLRTADGTSLTLSAAPMELAGEPCVPLADLAMALHGRPSLEPSLLLSGSALRARATSAPSDGLLVVRRAGLISERVRAGVDTKDPRQACVPAADIARAMGGVLAGSSIEQFDAQIDNMMNNNLAFLALQTKVQSVSQTTQMMSNILKADSDAKLNAIQNVRAAVFEETESALAGMPPDQVAWARSFASTRGHRATRTEIEAAIGATFPDASPREKIKIHMILLQIMMGDIIGALRSYAILMDHDLRHFSRQIVDKLDKVRQARSQVIRNFARTTPPRAYAGQDPQSPARAQDRAQRYTQFVQMSTQLMNELQNTERELVDALQTMQRDLDNVWQAYATMRD
ncbi:MAG TPA: hypothetical protein VFG78_04130 [Gemmatimonadota bacterium]|nr:hypothetical protein [Gemmatimonadota bacterium]